MRFLASLLLLAPLVISSPLEARDAQGVIEATNGIDITVRNLTQKVTAYQGGILQLEPVLAASLPIHDVNRRAKAIADASAPFTSEESKRIVETVQTGVTVSIPAGLQVLKSKKALFDQAEVTSVVRAFVTLLRRDHETYSASVGLKLTPDQLPAALAAAGKIDLALRDAELFLLAP